MFKSKDEKITVFTGKDANNVFTPADWSVVNIPLEATEAESLAKHLFNTPSSRHVGLLVTRSRREDRIDGISNIRFFKKDWKFLDNVNILYERASSCSKKGLLPVSETGFLVYKGTESPNVPATSWFNEKKPNATTFWDLRQSSLEDPEGEMSKHTYYQKFSWELQLLLYSMCKPLVYRKFIYGLKISDSEMVTLSKFCLKMNLSVQLFAKDAKRAEQLIKIYNILQEGL